MLDRDLAYLYGVPTKVLNQAVKRNTGRFPEDFMFSLSRQEILRMSQIVTSSEIGDISIKFSKNVNAFTEHGILMLSSVLNSNRAIAVNIQIMRTFAKLKRMFAGYKELKEKIDDMEKKYDGQFREVFDAVKLLMEPPTEAEKKLEIGFHKG
jgi:ORF6N domain